MKKIVFMLLAIFCISCLFASCDSNLTPAPASGSLELALEVSDTFTIEQDFFAGVRFVKPSGVLINGDLIFVVDSGDNCIHIFDELGEQIPKVGSTGNGPLQFIDPTAITYRDGLYYILDSKNLRVQIMNEDFTYNSERQLPENPADTPYIDIAVDSNKNIYVSTYYTQHKYSHITMVSKTSLITSIGERMVGYLSAGSSEIYFANTLELLDDFSRTGSSFLYILSENSMEDIFELPYKYMPMDFISTDDCFYMYSWARCTLDKFAKNGDYMETICQFAYETDMQYLCSNEDQSVFLLTSPETAEVFYIFK